MYGMHDKAFCMYTPQSMCDKKKGAWQDVFFDAQCAKSNSYTYIILASITT